jgi:hypothetical protein
LRHNKLIAVPHALISFVVWNTHNLCHRGIKGALELLTRRFKILEDVIPIIKGVKAKCQVWQAMTPPNENMPGALQFYPVPENIFQSIAMDFVKLPRVAHEGQMWDNLMTIVDRLSGYIIAIPCTISGLTEDKAAKTYLEKALERFGLPAAITTAKDIPFVTN